MHIMLADSQLSGFVVEVARTPPASHEFHRSYQQTFEFRFPTHGGVPRTVHCFFRKPISITAGLRNSCSNSTAMRLRAGLMEWARFTPMDTTHWVLDDFLNTPVSSRNLSVHANANRNFEQLSGGIPARNWSPTIPWPTTDFFCGDCGSFCSLHVNWLISWTREGDTLGTGPETCRFLDPGIGSYAASHHSIDQRSLEDADVDENCCARKPSGTAH